MTVDQAGRRSSVYSAEGRDRRPDWSMITGLLGPRVATGEPIVAEEEKFEDKIQRSGGVWFPGD